MDTNQTSVLAGRKLFPTEGRTFYQMKNFLDALFIFCSRICKILFHMNVSV